MCPVEYLLLACCSYSAYHGHVISLIDISPYKFNHPGGEGKKDWVHVVSFLFALVNLKNVEFVYFSVRLLFPICTLASTARTSTLQKKLFSFTSMMSKS